MNIGLLDGDIIVYEVAFCAERKIKEGKKVTEEHVKALVDITVSSLLCKAKVTHYLGYLTDSRFNFRLKVAKTLPYKGGRKTNIDKPAYYEFIRGYLVSQWKLQVVRGIEADDALVIASTYFRKKQKKTIIITKDKDLWQCPGYHYNITEHKHLYISEEQAYRNLWSQVLQGDLATDNIPGLSHAAKHEIYFKSEEHKAKWKPSTEELFGTAGIKKLLDNTRPEDYPRVILELYIDAYEAYEDTGLGEDRFLETFNLVYLLTEPPDGVEVNLKYHKFIPKFPQEDGENVVERNPKLEFEEEL